MSESQKTQQPNVLLIITDQQSADMLSCTGNPHVKTPNIDRLATRGIRFEGAYCSNPMCVPSRFSMMTGRYGSEAGIHANPHTRDKQPAPQSILDQGLGHLMTQGGYDAVFGGKQHFPGGMTAEKIGFEYIEKNERAQLAETTAQWLRDRGADEPEKPFFLIASFINPHDICYNGLQQFAQNDFEKILVKNGGEALEALEEALKLPEDLSKEEFFAGVCPPLPENYEPQIDEPEAIAHELTRRPFRRGVRENWGEREWRLHRWAYARLVERVDREIGVVFDALEAAGLDESTMIVFTSDHGEMNGSHRLEHKDVLYEECLRVPLLVRPAGATNEDARVLGKEALVSTGLDLLPTFCDLAGVEPPQGLPGVSFLPLVTGAKPSVRDFVPIEAEIGHAVVDPRFKLNRYFQGEPREQFFDLQTHPGDMQSVEIADYRANYNRLANAYTNAGLWQQ